MALTAILFFFFGFYVLKKKVKLNILLIIDLI